MFLKNTIEVLFKIKKRIWHFTKLFTLDSSLWLLITAFKEGKISSVMLAATEEWGNSRVSNVGQGTWRLDAGNGWMQETPMYYKNWIYLFFNNICLFTYQCHFPCNGVETWLDTYLDFLLFFDTPDAAALYGRWLFSDGVWSSLSSMLGTLPRILLKTAL